MIHTTESSHPLSTRFSKMYMGMGTKYAEHASGWPEWGWKVYVR